MIEFWNYISEIGLKSSYEESLKKRVMILNRINILASIVYFIIGIVYFTFGDTKTAIFIEALILFNVLAFFLQASHYYIFSLSFFLISSCLTIFYFDSYAGLASGAYLYYFPVTVSLFFLFDLKNEKAALFLHIVFVLGLFLINYFTDHRLFKSEILTSSMQHNLLISNALLSSISVIYFFYLAIKPKLP
jgi:hypothetical protein